jgi:pyrroline-5-carboxylate reductase
MIIGIIGVGRIGNALIKGFLEAKVLDKEQVIANDRGDKKLEILRTIGIQIGSKNFEVAEKSDAIIIAVKPKDIANVLQEIKEHAQDKLVISVAAGIRTNLIEEQIGGKVRVIRVMPNIACTVREAASVYCVGKYATSYDEETVRSLFEAIGTVFKLPEHLMDAVTGLSGSGPAYYFFIIKALAEAGANEGIPEEIAIKLAAQVAVGAGKTVLKETRSLNELIDMVCSPGGTTIEGLKVLEQGKVAENLREAVKRATNRSKELSK